MDLSETAQTDYRQVFCHHGVFVHQANVERLLTTFDSMEYPGNDAIPQEPERCYIYAGEMGFRYITAFLGQANNEKSLKKCSTRYPRINGQAEGSYRGSCSGVRLGELS